MIQALRGHVTDFGEIVRVESWFVKGRHLHPTWHIGAPHNTSAADRVVRGTPTPSTGKVDFVMDLKADQGTDLALGNWKDEMGNDAATPADVVVVYSVDNPAVLNLTDNADGTARADAIGVLGIANVHAEIDWTGGHATGDLQIVVVPGDAERVEIVAGEPTEVTPDV